jgi:L-alanine-DL-glutamate epimerase-like enolase superfamily enzyme
MPAVAGALLGDEARNESRIADLTRDLLPGSCAALSFALSTAVGSLQAEAAGLPLSSWLAREHGGSADAGRRAAVVPVNALIDNIDPARAASVATELRKAGYRAIKVKAGGEPWNDVQRVRAVRMAAGEGIELRVDANGGWTFDQALLALEAMTSEAIALVEQPVAPGPGALEAMARLADRFPAVAIAADESLAEGGALAAWQALAAVPGRRLAAVYKPMALGLGSLPQFAAMVRAGVPVIVTTTIDAGIGTVAAMHVAASLPSPRPACGLATLHLLAGDVTRGVPIVTGGEVRPPSRRGLGVELDEPALERFATGPWQDARR